MSEPRRLLGEEWAQHFAPRYWNARLVTKSQAGWARRTLQVYNRALAKGYSVNRAQLEKAQRILYNLQKMQDFQKKLYLQQFPSNRKYVRYGGGWMRNPNFSAGVQHTKAILKTAAEMDKQTARDTIADISGEVQKMLAPLQQGVQKNREFASALQRQTESALQGLLLGLVKIAKQFKTDTVRSATDALLGTISSLASFSLPRGLSARADPDTSRMSPSARIEGRIASFTKDVALSPTYIDKVADAAATWAKEVVP